MRDAQRTKHRYKRPELLQAGCCRLVVLGFEVGGKWPEDSLDFLCKLANARTRRVPQFLRQSAARAFAHRWSGLMAVAAQKALAASLLHLPLHVEANKAGSPPALSDLLADARWV